MINLHWYTYYVYNMKFPTDNLFGRNAKLPPGHYLKLSKQIKLLEHIFYLMECKERKKDKPFYNCQIYERSYYKNISKNYLQLFLFLST